MKLALFDLDHTLLPIDSADTWSHHVVAAGGLDADAYGRRIRRYAEQYHAGTFDPEDYVAFQMELLAAFDRATLDRFHAQFMREHVQPALRPEALALVARHRAAGDTLAIVTGTNSYVTTPIAHALGVPVLLGVEPEQVGGRFTGRWTGTHTYGAGKIRKVEHWLGGQGLSLDGLDDSVFYSDSINDLPLLERVRRPVVTNGDARLTALAAERGWPRLQLFDHRRAA